MLDVGVMLGFWGLHRLSENAIAIKTKHLRKAVVKIKDWEIVDKFFLDLQKFFKYLS